MAADVIRVLEVCHPHLSTAH